MQIGYARVSTLEQNVTPQIDRLKKTGCERIFRDKASGAKTKRPGLQEALDFLREGDSLVVWQFEETEANFRCLIRDNDSKYTEAFDTVFESQQTHIVTTPIRAPNANSYSERWIRSVREECFDHILIINEIHLRRVLNEYLKYYNSRRPHQGLSQQSPIPRPEPVTDGKVNRHKILSGIINDYFRSSEKTAVCPI